MAGAITVKLGDLNSDFTVPTMDMYAGNTVGVALPLNTFYTGPLSFGSTYRVQGVLSITPAAASNIFVVNFTAGGYFTTIASMINYTSVGTSLVDIPFDTTTTNADVYGVTNAFKLNGLFTTNALVKIKSLTITLTNG